MSEMKGMQKFVQDINGMQKVFRKSLFGNDLGLKVGNRYFFVFCQLLNFLSKGKLEFRHSAKL